MRIGPFSLRFDGRFLQETAGTTGARLDARDLEKSALGVPVLSGVSLSVSPCQFVGVIGPSGAGKSTLLDALCALAAGRLGNGNDRWRGPVRQLRSVDGENSDMCRRMISCRWSFRSSKRSCSVPGFACPRARRRPRCASWLWHTMRLLGLEERAHTPVGRLSGGQRKRVSVGAELLCRPRLMFLDEPTSGLDPAAEFRLMESLRHLAATGCTILCTTHVLGNAFLFDRLAVMFGGRLVFFGEPADALEYFGVERLTLLYDALSDQPASNWPRALRKSLSAAGHARSSPKHKRSSALPILLLRQWAIFRADWKNLLLALGQPVFIGLLVTWVSNDPPLVLFFAYIATLWFGCGNAAQEIVKELPMFRRERLIGLGRHGYLLAKFLSLARITGVQSLLLYGVMQLLTGGLGGAVGWQIPGLVLAACAAVGIGLAISAGAKSVLQAVMIVPLVLIPQILFSGFMPPAGDMKAGPYFVSRLMPSAAVQSVMDTSLFWQRKIGGSMRVDYPSAFSNLNRDKSLKNGQVYMNANPAGWGLGPLQLGRWRLLGGVVRASRQRKGIKDASTDRGSSSP